MVSEAEAGERTVAVMGFENLNDPTDAENLSRVLVGLVNTDLAETGGLKVVTTSKVLAALKEAGAGAGGFEATVAFEGARIAGAQVMLVGQVIQDGDHMILTAELADVGTGNTLGSIKKEAASSSELFALAEAIADDVRKRLGVREGAGERFDLATSLTDSPEAYRQYAAGELALHRGS